MMRLAICPERAPHGAKGKAQQTGPAGEPSVQPSVASVAPHASRHTENVPGGNPVATGDGRIADRKNPICSFIVKNTTMHCKSSAKLVEYNASAGWYAPGWRQKGDGVAVANDRRHAGAAGAEGDRRALLEKRGDDFLDFGHDGGGFRTKKV